MLCLGVQYFDLSTLRYYRLIENLEGRTPLGFGPGSGRWNQYGTPLIYACSHTSLNFLELLSIRGPVVTKSQWSLVIFDVHAEVPYVDSADLPKDWTQRPHPKSTQYMGTYWAQQKDSIALIVPSCRIPLVNYPQEHNLLLNPLHPDFLNQVDLIGIEPVNFLV